MRHIRDSWNYQEMNFKIFITSILKILMNKLNCLQEHLGSVSRKMEILRRKQKLNARDQNHYYRNEECL